MGAKRAARGAINSFFKHSWHYKFHFWLCFHINLSSLCTFKRGSCKIIWAISLENNYSTKDFLYWPDWCFISSPTTKLALSLSKLGIKLRLVFNHAWLQTLMEEPFPILQIKSCLRTTSEPWILGTLNGTRIMPKLSFHDLLWWEIFTPSSFFFFPMKEHSKFTFQAQVFSAFNFNNKWHQKIKLKALMMFMDKPSF